MSVRVAAQVWRYLLRRSQNIAVRERAGILYRGQKDLSAPRGRIKELLRDCELGYDRPACLNGGSGGQRTNGEATQIFPSVSPTSPPAPNGFRNNACVHPSFVLAPMLPCIAYYLCIFLQSYPTPSLQERCVNKHESNMRVFEMIKI
jgi:hypothetical protein